MSTFLHFLQFLHFEEILKTHALLTLLVKISPQMLTINLKICSQFLVIQLNQMFTFKKMTLLMCTMPLLPLAPHFWNQLDTLLLRNRLAA
jgi:hypothetical protein